MNLISGNSQITISKQELAELPCVCCQGDVTVISAAEDVDAASDILERSRIIGFDTETRPSFRKGLTHTVALMQLATPERCFLFRINKFGLHERLVRLLENPLLLKVGVSIHDDFLNLNRLKQLKPAGFIDLQQFVKHFHIADNSLTRIHAILFGERISKGQRLTNWEAETLSSAQINYAALDAISCIRIYDYLMSGRFNPSASKYLRPVPEPSADPLCAAAKG